MAAGGALARQLQVYAGCDDVVVLALPRGGVPVAWEVARALRAKLDVLVVHRLYVPYRTGPAARSANKALICFLFRYVAFRLECLPRGRIDPHHPPFPDLMDSPATVARSGSRQSEKQAESPTDCQRHDRLDNCQTSSKRAEID